MLLASLTITGKSEKCLLQFQTRVQKLDSILISPSKSKRFLSILRVNHCSLQFTGVKYTARHNSFPSHTCTSLQCCSKQRENEDVACNHPRLDPWPPSSKADLGEPKGADKSRELLNTVQQKIPAARVFCFLFFCFFGGQCKENICVKCLKVVSTAREQR